MQSSEEPIGISTLTTTKPYYLGISFQGLIFQGLFLAPALKTVFAHKMVADLAIIDDNEAEKSKRHARSNGDGFGL